MWYIMGAIQVRNGSLFLYLLRAGHSYFMDFKKKTRKKGNTLSKMDAKTNFIQNVANRNK